MQHSGQALGVLRSCDHAFDIRNTFKQIVGRLEIGGSGEMQSPFWQTVRQLGP